jgi:hypothetical protein
MEFDGVKRDLHRYLQVGREALLCVVDRHRGVTRRADERQGLYRRVWANSDGTLAALELDTLGRVPWWPAGDNEVTLHALLIHMIAETHRHAGHADIVRETIDGSVGLRADNDNLAEGDAAWWADYRNRLETAARQAR